MAFNHISGISVCNPVIVKKEYLNKTIEYAIKNGINHVQIIGPDTAVGNLDGMIEYKKYSKFNSTKDFQFIANTKDAFYSVLPKAKEAGIKLYVWHHELELPVDFAAEYPETLNSDGDYEVTHPLIKDFIENKVNDFFDQYSMIDGIVLTLHETRVPLLKLKNQKLDKTERVKYVTKIIYDTCISRGKELIVRPFASLEEDYTMFMNAYAEISHDLPVMDKWTQFDWSLTLPSNKFFNKIKYNPLFVETDIFGEYFGKGRLPLMLLNHIKEKVAYCESFPIKGFASRIDRDGMDPFDEVNEVNLAIMTAMTHGEDPSVAADKFFEEKYPGVGKEIREIMNPTEDILRKIIYLKGYYYSELSYFPAIQHSKNHYYFEMMKDNYSIVSDEWFIPQNWNRGTLDSVRAEKAEAVSMSKELLQKVELLQDRINIDDYANLHNKFLNLKLVAEVWQLMTEIFIHYTRFFDDFDINEEKLLNEYLDKIVDKRNEGEKLLSNKFYCLLGDNDEYIDFVNNFVSDIKKSFEAEKRTTIELKALNPYDYIVCAGGYEGHNLKKEVNFCDVNISDDGYLYRVPGAKRAWSQVNAHGWISYELNVKPGSSINVMAGSLTNELHLKITIDDKVNEIHENLNGNKKLYTFKNISSNNTCRIRFDRLTADTPCIFYIYVK